LKKASVQTGEIVLHSFNPYPQGAYPQANVCRGPGNMFFGTAAGGGPVGAGVVYSLNSAGHGTVLYSFTGGADGANPYASVICNSAGNIYGATLLGGSAGAGVVFRVNALGHESVLYGFTGGAGPAGTCPKQVSRSTRLETSTGPPWAAGLQALGWFTNCPGPPPRSDAGGGRAIPRHSQPAPNSAFPRLVPGNQSRPFSVECSG
jgi:uncharacterized repeat protein (TIGR03803 family)